MTPPPDQRPAKTIGPDRKRTAVCFIPWGVFTYYIALSVLGMIYMVYGAWEANPLKVGAGLATMVNYFWSLCTFHYVKITPGEIIRYSFLGLRRKRIPVETVESADGGMYRANPVTGGGNGAGDFFPAVYVLCHGCKGVDLTITGSTYLNQKLLSYLRAGLRKGFKDLSEEDMSSAEGNWSRKWTNEEWCAYVLVPLLLGGLAVV